jgi:hypothetical protein
MLATPTMGLASIYAVIGGPAALAMRRSKSGSAWQQMSAAAQVGSLSQLRAMSVRTPLARVARSALISHLVMANNTGGSAGQASATPAAAPATPTASAAPAAGTAMTLQQIATISGLQLGHVQAINARGGQSGSMLAAAQAGNLAGVQASSPSGNTGQALKAVLVAHLTGAPIPAMPASVIAASLPSAPVPSAPSASAAAMAATQAAATHSATVTPTGAPGARLSAQHIGFANGQFSIPTHPDLESDLNAIMAGGVPAGFTASGYGGMVTDNKTGLVVAPGMTNFVQHRIAEALGFNGLPQVQPKTKVDALVKADPKSEAFRAVGVSGAYKGKELLDQLREKGTFFGNGVYGNGTYTAQVGNHKRDGVIKDSAKYAGRKANGGGIPPGAQARLFIPLDKMDVITIQDVRKAKQSYSAAGLAAPLQAVHAAAQHFAALASAMSRSGRSGHHHDITAAFDDEATLAMVSGHDVIHIPSGNGTGADYVNVLNRTKIIVQKENHQ